jgi:hypothetical protein
MLNILSTLQVPLQPEKSGVKSGTNRTILTANKITDVFVCYFFKVVFVHLKGDSRALNRKNRFQRLGTEKGGVSVLMGLTLQKN